MRKEKDVAVNLGGYRPVRFDSMNLEMEELRRPDARKARKHTEIKDDSPRWYRMGHYFQSIASGVSWLLEHRMLNEGGGYALEESVKRYREIADELRGMSRRPLTRNENRESRRGILFYVFDVSARKIYMDSA